ncbi:pyridoxamine phosphate oxidase family protein [Trichoderma chlorosporum]
MVHYYDSLSDDLRDWALQQKVFFTASAPLKGRHVNVSPKGLLDATFHIFDPNHAAYLDTPGSGIETVSHVYENKRITLMFCSLDEKPRIMRLFCTGIIVERTDPKFPELFKSIGNGDFPLAGIRAIVMLEILQVRIIWAL